MCWHYDPCQGRPVRGINLLNALYHSGGVSIPAAFERVRKPYRFWDIQTRREKRTSEIFRQGRRAVGTRGIRRAWIAFLGLENFPGIECHCDGLMNSGRLRAGRSGNRRLSVFRDGPFPPSGARKRRTDYGKTEKRSRKLTVFFANACL